MVTAITPDVHGNAVLELGHGDNIAIPGVNATFLQQHLQNLVHLHASPSGVRLARDMLRISECVSRS